MFGSEKKITKHFAVAHSDSHAGRKWFITSAELDMLPAHLRDPKELSHLTQVIWEDWVGLPVPPGYDYFGDDKAFEDMDNDEEDEEATGNKESNKGNGEETKEDQ
jgi:hypothetical protein